MFTFLLDDGLKYTAESYNVIDEYSGVYYVLYDVDVEYSDFLKCHIDSKAVYGFEIIEFMF